MKIKLYKCFEHWYHGGTIWVYSDPHFQNDTEMEQYFGWIPAEEQLQRINQCVTKNDTLICLGDVGNKLELASKIKAGYKVLITGNHDRGASTYTREQRNYGICESETEAKAIIRDGISEILNIGGFKPNEYVKLDDSRWLLRIDNHLFDEVYTGPLFISDKILLSHEKITMPCCINIHGHEHRGQFMEQVEMHTVAGPVQAVSYNVACDVVDFKPMRLDQIVQNYPLKNVPSIHRLTIDRAVAGSVPAVGKLDSYAHMILQAEANKGKNI